MSVRAIGVAASLRPSFAPMSRVCSIIVRRAGPPFTRGRDASTTSRWSRRELIVRGPFRTNSRRSCVCADICTQKTQRFRSGLGFSMFWVFGFRVWVVGISQISCKFRDGQSCEKWLD